MQKKKIVQVNNSVILAKGDGDFAMHDVVRVGNLKLLGEVIKIQKNWRRSTWRRCTSFTCFGTWNDGQYF